MHTYAIPPNASWTDQETFPVAGFTRVSCNSLACKLEAPVALLGARPRAATQRAVAGLLEQCVNGLRRVPPELEECPVFVVEVYGAVVGAHVGTT
jgi:hypothetical protein